MTTPTDPSPADVVGRLLERPGDVTGAPECVRVAQDGSDMRGGFWTCAAAHEGSPKFIRADLVASAITALQARAEKAERERDRLRDNNRTAWVALRMIREAVEEFGPVADLESSDAVLLRGPEATHEAEAIVEALIRVRARALANKETENV